MNELIKINTSNVKKLGAVYTPDLLSDWVASELLKHLEKGAILDPACGDGALLSSISMKSKIPLIGADIVSSELLKAHHRLSHNSSINTFSLNSLIPQNNDNPFEYWKKIFHSFNIKNIISNPPWGAEITPKDKKTIETFYDLASGQYDTYELFIELMLKSSPINTSLAFIIPDSIFQPEKKKLRKLILDNSRIKLIARLGEGFFKNVFRGTTVIILKKSLSENNSNLIDCFRLSKEWRTNILLQNISIADAQETLTHQISQERFTNNENFMFDIDINEKENTIKKIESINSLNWNLSFKTGRGIELSKTGKIIKCPNCQNAQPFPRKNIEVKCDCGTNFQANKKNEISIISNTSKKNTLPLIVGEDVTRYNCSNSRFIFKEIKGINYKKNIEFKEPKLLIRKTGVGINASIDYSGAYTNQVVFHYSLNRLAQLPEYSLEFLLGVMSSRVMCAYYLKKFGENEWRSHAYITQSIISKLPIPNFVNSKEKTILAKKIAASVKKMLLNKDKRLQKLDIEIEKNVIKLFELNRHDIAWVIDTLKSAQQLKSIQALQLSIDQEKELYEL